MNEPGPPHTDRLDPHASTRRGREPVVDSLRPAGWEEALAAKAEHPTAVPIAGGTDVMVEIDFDHRRPEYLMDLTRIGDLHAWEVGEDTVRLGASVPYAKIMEHPRAELPGLALASRTVASPQIRNRGGVGGNLGTASPAGDAHPALLAAGAEVEVEPVRGSRRTPVDDFCTGVKRNALAPDELVREEVLELGRRKPGSSRTAWAHAGLLLEDGKVVTDAGEVLADLVDVLGDEAVEVEEERRHRPTRPFDPHTGQGDGHVPYSFAAHRAVVEADTELGLVEVAEPARAQDVGKALNPLSVVGQIQGGTTQGPGMAVMEEILVDPDTAKVRTPSFTDYLIPTVLDTPAMPVDVLELADDRAPYGLRGVGEAPTLSSTPAVLAAIRAATGPELNRTPVRPEHLTGTARD
ncbi:FAD binding domain-containing protein [Streptomyces sp. enrichment culture]|uniref:FAD binding domain-containing protein n=1 Tax=Streptomyces sp. enrichment culture TaxID=1795815 RepID=UPI003F5646EB